MLGHPTVAALVAHPETLYRYPRRRETPLGGNRQKPTRMYEFFGEGQHRSAHRYYAVGNGILRDEQLDAQGRVVRIVTVDGWHRPEKARSPDIDEAQLTDAGMAVKGRRVHHRVYERDAQGAWKLVAASWNRTPGKGNQDHGLVYLDQDDDVVYGTPDGASKWADFSAFEHAFGTSRRAAQVFPDDERGIFKLSHESFPWD